MHQSHRPAGNDFPHLKQPQTKQETHWSTVLPPTPSIFKLIFFLKKNSQKCYLDFV